MALFQTKPLVVEAFQFTSYDDFMTNAPPGWLAKLSAGDIIVFRDHVEAGHAIQEYPVQAELGEWLVLNPLTGWSAYNAAAMTAYFDPYPAA